RGVAVEVALVDVLDDAVRDEVPDGFARVDALAALGGGDRQGGDLHEGDPPVGQAGVGEAVTGTGHADEVREPEQLVGVVPGEHLLQRVGAGDEEHLGVGPVDLAHVAERVHGVGGSGPVDVDAADGEAGVGRRGDHGHEVAVLGGGDPAVRLVGGQAGGHEHDLVEGVEVRDLARGHEVPVVDRV